MASARAAEDKRQHKVPKEKGKAMKVGDKVKVAKGPFTALSNPFGTVISIEENVTYAVLVDMGGPGHARAVYFKTEELEVVE